MSNSVVTVEITWYCQCYRTFYGLIVLLYHYCYHHLRMYFVLCILCNVLLYTHQIQV